MAVEPSLSAERHAIDLAANAMRWLLADGQLDGAHPGVRAHATACATQLIACQALLPKEET